ncbi:MAG: helix-turn-helix transcriptional regulator, partial [Oscillospiraceae bacterium]|nr:helix-turn-helix transcriptional regulator [Oscillospiraceae bacterium]
MDLVKIGKYLAAKRKALGLTQRQLAEQLGMSDKSVSKWEWGVCLPDVSLYEGYCAILGISLHEFLAGEDLAEENIVKQSEENLIQVATDSKQRQKKLKAVIAALAVLTLAAGVLAALLLLRPGRPRNSITPMDRESAEMKTAELLS